MKTKLVITLILFLITHLLYSQDIETVKIGNQEWMKKNLNIATDSSFCYSNEEKNCEIFGRLYNWETALIICPEGFRLPSDKDWSELTENVGGLKIAGFKLLMGGESGFNVLLGGNYNSNWRNPNQSSPVQ